MYYHFPLSVPAFIISVLEAAIEYAWCNTCLNSPWVTRYIAEGMDIIFTQSGLELIFHVLVEIYKDLRRQSEHELLDIGPLRNGLMSVKSLKAKARFVRDYYLFSIHVKFLLNRENVYKEIKEKYR